MMGFIAEFVVYRSSFEVFPVATLLSMVGTALTAVYFLIMINKVFFGRLPDHLANLPKVRWQDRIPAVMVTLLIIFLGIQPSWMARWSESTATAIVKERLERRLPVVAAGQALSGPQL
jgi:NAD(P)H-quinone oxidoreductase subunit 4